MRQTGFIGVLRLFFLGIGFVLFLFMVVVSARSASSQEAVAGKRAIATVLGVPLISIAQENSSVKFAGQAQVIQPLARHVSSIKDSKLTSPRQTNTSAPTPPSAGLARVEAASVPPTVAKAWKSQSLPPVSPPGQRKIVKTSGHALGL